LHPDRLELIIPIGDVLPSRYSGGVAALRQRGDTLVDVRRRTGPCISSMASAAHRSSSSVIGHHR
jgi:hypothetical protein